MVTRMATPNLAAYLYSNEHFDKYLKKFLAIENLADSGRMPWIPALDDLQTVRFELPRFTAHRPACSRASAGWAWVKSGLSRSACS